MLTINDQHYSHQDFEQQYQRFERLPFESSNGARIAFCLEDPFTWLALCFYLKQHHVSVMPIHPTTPLATAKRQAEKAGCSQLYYHDLAAPIELAAPESTATPQAGLIQMSSGTTGEPKCINRCWLTIDQEIKSYIESFPIAADMTPVIACPVTHSYGLISGVMVALARGQSPTIVTNINPKFLIKTLVNCDRPLLYSSPTMLQGLMRLWPANTKLHAVMTSGTLMSAAVFQQLAPKINHFFQQYGCSEAGCIAINQQLKEPNELGTPLPHVRIVSSNDRNNPAEIVITVATAESTEQVIHTQDLGYLKSTDKGETLLCFVARQDDTIIVAGLNVYPHEVEDTVLGHPSIQDAVVFKIHDEYAGQRVCLQYVTDQSLDSNSLRQWCCEHLANYQVPQQLQQVEQIERMPNGKVSRKKIAADFEKIRTQQHPKTA